MVFDAITAHVQDVHDELKRLVSRVVDLPNSKSVRFVEGSSGAVAGHFTSLLNKTAESAGLLTEAVLEELNNADSAVRAALDELATQDNDIALGADQVEASIRGSGQTVPPRPTNAPSSGADHINWGSHSQDGTPA